MERRISTWILAGLLVAGCGEELDGGGAPAEMPDAEEADGVVEDARPADVSPAADVEPDAPGREDAAVADVADADDAADTTAAPRSYTVAVVSDMNSSYGSTSYLDEVHGAADFITRSLEPDLVISAGDMVAGQKHGLDYRAMWSAFHRTVTDRITAAGIPFAPTPGNHDASGYPAYDNERDIYVDEWNTKKPNLNYVEDTYFPLRYAFRLGPALFVSLDDTTVGPLGDPQMMWLDTVLEENADAPVKIVYGHLPLWGFASEKTDEIIGDDDLEEMLERHDVDMFVSGHHHAYYPGRRRELRMLSMACLGTGPRELIGEGRTSRRSLAVFEYDASGIASVDAYLPPDFTQRVPRTMLPTSVDDGNAIVVRDDTM